jgi:hypothetical protein
MYVNVLEYFNHIMIRKGVRQLDRGLKKEMKNPLAKVIARKGIWNELTEV